MNNKRIIILDTEGLSLKNCRPYNVGYVIADLYGNIYEKKNYVIEDAIWENLINSNSFTKELLHKNISEFLSDPDTLAKYPRTSTNEFKEILKEDIKKYKIKEIWAYNAPFDRSKIASLFDVNKDEIEDLLNISFCDILPLVATYICKKDYLKFCIAHNNKALNDFISDKGNFRITAEKVYAYITNNPNFSEEHKALDDVEIEYKCFLVAYIEAKKKKKKVKIKKSGSHIVNKFAEKKGFK